MQLLELVPLWSQEASSKNITPDADQEESKNLEPSPPQNVPPFIYQTTSFLPSTASCSSLNHSPSQALAQTVLPPTKHPIERKLSKGLSTYCGIFFGLTAGLQAGAFAWNRGLRILAIYEIAIGTGMIVGLAFTYCAWKFLNYYFES